jgi:hypothetical protein
MRQGRELCTLARSVAAPYTRSLAEAGFGGFAQTVGILRTEQIVKRCVLCTTTEPPELLLIGRDRGCKIYAHLDCIGRHTAGTAPGTMSPPQQGC